MYIHSKSSVQSKKYYDSRRISEKIQIVEHNYATSHARNNFEEPKITSMVSKC